MSSPYYQFGGLRQRFMATSWNAGTGGVLPATRTSQAAQARSGLGANEIPNLEEMTLGPDTLHTPAFRRTSLHQRFPRREALFGVGAACMEETGDWPLVYPKGPEAPDPNQDSVSPYLFTKSGRVPQNPATLAGVLDLSDNEKIVAVVAAAGLGLWLWKRSKKRRTRR